MALLKCKECGNEVSTSAKACPKCGAVMPKRTSMFTKLVAGFFGLAVVMAVVGGKSGPTAPTASAPAATAPSATATPAPTALAAAPEAGTLKANANASAGSKPAVKPGAALALLAKKTDKIEGIDWYRDKTSSTSLGANTVGIYMGVKSGNPWLRLRFDYAGSDWLFVEKALVVVDGVKFSVTSGRWERDNDTRVYEWLDVPIEPSQMNMIRTMASAKEVTIRYEGRQYKKDRNMSAQELKAMRNVLAAYAEMGGT